MSFSFESGMLSTPGAQPARSRLGLVGLVMGDCREIPQGLVGDVGPALEHLIRGLPILVADLARAEDVAAAPAALHVFDALEELGVAAALAVDALHRIPIRGDVTATTPFRVAEQDEERAGDVDENLVALRGFRHDVQIAILRDGADHARQGRHLAEPDGVKVFERVEIDDHAALAFCDLARQQPVPIAGARGALNVDRPHAVLLLHPGQIVGAVARVDHVLGDAALAEVLRLRFDLDEVGGSPAVYDFAFTVVELSRLIEVDPMQARSGGSIVARLPAQQTWSSSPCVRSMKLRTFAASLSNSANRNGCVRSLRPKAGRRFSTPSRPAITSGWWT